MHVSSVYFTNLSTLRSQRLQKSVFKRNIWIESHYAFHCHSCIAPKSKAEVPIHLISRSFRIISRSVNSCLQKGQGVSGCILTSQSTTQSRWKAWMHAGFDDQVTTSPTLYPDRQTAQQLGTSLPVLSCSFKCPVSSLSIDVLQVLLVSPVSMSLSFGKLSSSRSSGVLESAVSPSLSSILIKSSSFTVICTLCFAKLASNFRRRLSGDSVFRSSSRLRRRAR